MIPKTIHYCWFGGKDKPEIFKQYHQIWKRLLPDYEIREWNEENFDVEYCHYSREAYLTGNYAHVSDVCRLYALYKHGGIYLDTDVEVLSSFDRFLPLNSFVSLEPPFVGTAVIGAEAETTWIREFLKYYRRTHFINCWGHTVRMPNTHILCRKILPSLPITALPTIFPTEYFCGIRNSDRSMSAGENTVAIHHFAGSWLRKKTFSQKILSIINGFEIRYLKK